MRFVLCAFLLCWTLPVAAQTHNADIARASHMLAANWRPLEVPSQAGAEAAFIAACEGAVAEMAALDARLPDDLSSTALAQIRAPLGLIIVPTVESPATAYVFANAELPTIASGLAAIAIVDAAQGRVDLTDAAGASTRLQLGAADGKALLRILREGAEPLLYVGCASTLG